MMKRIALMSICVGIIFPEMAMGLTSQQRHFEEDLNQIATNICKSESIKGEGKKITALANGDIKLSVFGKKGAGLNLKFVFSKNKWEGMQNVLQKDLANERKDFRSCKQNQISFLRSSYVPPRSPVIINKCVAKKIEKYEIAKSKSVEGGARTDSKKNFGNIPRSSVPLCISVGSEEKIISTSSPVNTCCHGGRCSVSAAQYSNNNRQVCINTKCWSEDKIFGSGGCGKYRFTISYKSIANAAQKKQFRLECM